MVLYLTIMQTIIISNDVKCKLLKVTDKKNDPL